MINLYDIIKLLQIHTTVLAFLDTNVYCWFIYDGINDLFNMTLELFLSMVEKSVLQSVFL